MGLELDDEQIHRDTATEILESLALHKDALPSIRISIAQVHATLELAASIRSLKVSISDV